MANLIEIQIHEAEESLRQAMLNSDVDALSKLLAPELTFTNHFGQVSGKQEDLNAHKSGLINIDVLEIEELRIQDMGKIVITFVKVHLVGSYADNSFDNWLRFTRIWNLSHTGNWQIVAAHSCLA